jgi:TRAP transporter TAXI family solute receptor
MTRDPDIKTFADIEGKRVASSPKGGTANLMFEFILKANGLHDKIKLQHVGFADVDDVLADGLADVGLVGTWYNNMTKEIRPWQAIVEAQASGKNYRFIGAGKSAIDKAKAEGLPTMMATVPAGKLKGQPKPLNCYVNAPFHAVDATFPEEYAYELVKTMIEKMDKLQEYGGFAEMLSVDFMPYELEGLLHKGALKAYKEKGLIK